MSGDLRFLMVLKCLCFYLPVITSYPSDKPPPPVITSALQLLIPRKISLFRLPDISETFLSDEHRVNVKKEKKEKRKKKKPSHTQTTYSQTAGALVFRRTCAEHRGMFESAHPLSTSQLVHIFSLHHGVDQH